MEQRWSLVRVQYIWLFVALLSAAPHAISQQVIDNFLPEIDVYRDFGHNWSGLFQVKETRENGEPTQAEFGPSLSYIPKGRLSLDSGTAHLTLAIGYRYLASPGKQGTNRLEPVVTLSQHMKKIVLSDKNRADLDWQGGGFNWTYRNRVDVRTSFKIHGYEPRPYVAAEVFYKSQYAKWTDTALYAGCEFPLGKHAMLGPYYEHQNVTSKAPNQQDDQFGLVLGLIF
jgi:hypothetical protein